MIIMLQAVVIGILGGLVYGAVGYLKDRPLERFRWQKFVRSVIIAGIAGGYAAWQGIAINEAMIFLESIGITVLVEQILKIVWRRAVRRGVAS